MLTTSGNDICPKLWVLNHIAPLLLYALVGQNVFTHVFTWIFTYLTRVKVNHVKTRVQTHVPFGHVKTRV